jgi:hypothetical protein
MHAPVYISLDPFQVVASKTADKTLDVTRDTTYLPTRASTLSHLELAHGVKPAKDLTPDCVAVV